MKVQAQHLRALTTLFSGASPVRKIAAGVLLLGALAGAIWPDAGDSHRADGQIEGVVVGVADGDTITVLDDSRQQHKVRFAFIDAPEKAQPFGTKAKQELSDKLYRRQVRVEVLEQDRYGRNVGRIWLGDEDVNLGQLRAGYAWHYRQYARKGQSAQEFSRYEQAQQAAQQQRQGLWQDATPVPPWDFRRQHRAG
ncbi:thermonuclease family protein [Vogesella fluminis]|uniref:Nuclease n=1 Tax=Vogesella fluminis TaxID=1069161 RepID=A0ABQ3HDF0_9NEIS|nr:thermonuclease family protein [Vogesella fluminis]GHD76511.1 nuclease [Vogesella fluminis]